MLSKISWGQIGSYLIRVGFVFLLYLITALFGLQLQAVSRFAALVWPPTGIALAALFIFGYRMWPAILLAAFFANMITGASPLVAGCIAIGNMTEALIGVFLLRRLVGFQTSLTRVRDAVGFIIIALLCTLVSATVGVLALLLGGLVTIPAFQPTWLAWWVGDVLGALIVAPLILTWWSNRNSEYTTMRWWELVFIFCIHFVLSVALFGGQLPEIIRALPVQYLVYMTLVWIAVRFNPREAISAVAVTSVIAIWGTLQGIGPFIIGTAGERLFSLQTFMGIVAATVILLAAAIAERRTAMENLSRVNTELAAQTEALETEKDKYAALLLSLGDGVIATDSKSVIIVINSVAEHLLGVTAGEALGKPIKHIFTMQDEAGHPLAAQAYPIAQAMEMGKIIRTSISPTIYMVAKETTPFPVAMTATPIRFNSIRGATIVFRDITFEKNIDRAKSEFVSVASHQLRTPLTAMRWYAESLLDEDFGALNPKQKEYVKVVYESNERLIHLVNLLLGVSRIELGTVQIEPEPSNLTEIVDSILHDLHVDIARNKLKIVRHIDTKSKPLNIDPQVMRIALQNVMSNAVYYNRPGGSLTIEIISNHEIIIRISDNGYGIPQADQQHIFTKFYRTDKARELKTDGTGLGLYIVKTLLQTAGGDITFTSVENKGTIFTITIPLAGMVKKEGYKISN